MSIEARVEYDENAGEWSFYYPFNVEANEDLSERKGWFDGKDKCWKLRGGEELLDFAENFAERYGLEFF